MHSFTNTILIKLIFRVLTFSLLCIVASTIQVVQSVSDRKITVRATCDKKATLTFKSGISKETGEEQRVSERENNFSFGERAIGYYVRFTT